MAAGSGSKELVNLLLPLMTVEQKKQLVLLKNEERDAAEIAIVCYEL